MKVSNFVKNMAVALVFITSVITSVAMEKEGVEKPLTADDIKNNYLIITKRGAMPAWIRVKNNDGDVFIEKERKNPVRALSNAYSPFYTNSSYEDRILADDLAILIPYDQMKFPLRIRVWTHENRDDNDSSSSLAFLFIEENKEGILILHAKHSPFYAFVAAIEDREEIACDILPFDRLNPFACLGFGTMNESDTPAQSGGLMDWVVSKTIIISSC